MAFGRIGPLGFWDKFDERWIGTRRAARWFFLATLFVLTTLPLFLGYAPSSGAIGKAYGVVAGIGGTLSIFFVWIGMWKYWARLDTSTKWAKRLWFLVMLACFWYGGCLYCWCVYLPQVVRAGEQGVTPLWDEQSHSRSGIFGKSVAAAWLSFAALVFILMGLTVAFPRVGSAFKVLFVAAPLLVLATFLLAIVSLYRQGIHRG